jgi:uncharacterized membrane protein (DUF106 family)
MVLLVTIGMVFSWLLPKLVDPEALKEAQETIQNSEQSVKGLFNKN